MQDRELYRRILGIEAPWYVERVELKLAEGEVHVYLEHEDVEEWACGECGAEAKPYDHQAERGWRHLDTCQYQMILHARPPRAECPEHGVRVVKLPWAEPSSRLTALFEALAIVPSTLIEQIGSCPAGRAAQTARAAYRACLHGNPQFSASIEKSGQRPSRFRHSSGRASPGRRDNRSSRRTFPSP